MISNSREKIGFFYIYKGIAGKLHAPQIRARQSHCQGCNLSFMKNLRLNLEPTLSAVSWFFIESFVLITLAFLPFSKSVSDICVVIALILWVLRKFPWNERLRAPKAVLVCYLVFLAANLLSLAHVPHPLLGIGIRGFLKWLKFVGLFFMCAELFQDPKRVARFVPVFLWSMTVACLNGFYQLGAGADLLKHYSVDIPGRFTRMQSSFCSPNGLSAFLILAIPLVFSVWVRQEKWSFKSVAASAGLAVFSVSFAMTLSRAAFFALVLAVLIFLLRQKSMKALLFLLALTALFLFSSDITRLNFFASLHLTDITIGERLRFWQTTWHMIKAHPWMGNGVNMFFQKFPGFAPESETYRGYAHNCYLQMWSEVGLFGLLAFLAPVALTLWRWLVLKKPSSRDSLLRNALAVGLMAFLVHAALDTHFYSLQTALLFWMSFGLLISLE